MPLNYSEVKYDLDTDDYVGSSDCKIYATPDDLDWNISIGTMAFLLSLDKFIVFNGTTWLPLDDEVVTTAYSLSSSATSVTEGNAVTITFNSPTAVLDGTTVGFTITGVDVSDISLLSLTGSFTVDSTQPVTITIGIEADGVTETGEVMVMTLDALDSAGNATGSPTVSVSIGASDQVQTPNVTLLRKIMDYDETSNFTGGGTGYTSIRNSFLFPGLGNTYHDFTFYRANAATWWLGTGAINLSGADGFTFEFAVETSYGDYNSYTQVFGNGYNNFNTHTLKFGGLQHRQNAFL